MGLTLNETSEEIFGYSLLFCTILIMPSFYGIFIILSSILLLDICEVVKNTFVVSILYSFISIIIPSYLNFALYTLHIPNMTPLLIPMVLTLCLYAFLKKKTSKILILIYNILCVVSFVIFYFFELLQFDYVISAYFFQNVIGLFMANWMKNKLSKING